MGDPVGSPTFVSNAYHPAVDYCRELAMHETLYGSAPEATRWIALEDNGRWGAKVPRESELPEPVKAWLLAQERPGTRVLLIRRAAARRGTARRLLLARTPAEPSERRLVELDLALDEVPTIDVDAQLDAATPTPSATLWLVCTHGARDRCCAKWGMPIVDALEQRGERVWQASHLGGHRFAPTFVALPQGLMWGRVAPEQLGTLVEALADGRVEVLTGLRGRSCWPPLAQAAEALLRGELPPLGLDALTLRAIVPLGEGRHRVEFGRRDQAELEHAIVVGHAEFAGSPASCGEAPAPRRVLVQLATT